MARFINAISNVAYGSMRGGGRRWAALAANLLPDAGGHVAEDERVRIVGL
jgi:hypothetical protein